MNSTKLLLNVNDADETLCIVVGCKILAMTDNLNRTSIQMNCFDRNQCQ